MLKYKNGLHLLLYIHSGFQIWNPRWSTPLGHRSLLQKPSWGRRDRVVVGCTTTFAISAYHHWSCEFEPHSLWGHWCTWYNIIW